MPVDAEGQRAHIVMDPIGTYNRMNAGRIIEQYLSACARKTTLIICDTVGIAYGTPKSVSLHMLDVNNPALEVAFQHWVAFHGLVNPKILEWVRDGVVGKDRVDFIAQIIEHGIYVYYPTDNQAEAMEVINTFESTVYRPHLGPVTYVDMKGRTVKTKMNVRIGSVYIIELNKPGTDMNAASITRLHPYGTPAVLTGADNYRLPYREQSSRGFGEAEIRGMASYGPIDYSWQLVAEIMDRNTSPNTIRQMAKVILTAPAPGNISQIVDRAKFPYGTGRPLQIANHVLQCAGIEFVHEGYLG